MYKGVTPLLSNNSKLGRLSLDRDFAVHTKTHYNTSAVVGKTPEAKSRVGDEGNRNREVQVWDKKKTGAIRLLSGDRAGEDRAVTSPY